MANSEQRRENGRGRRRRLSTVWAPALCSAATLALGVSDAAPPRRHRAIHHPETLAHPGHGARRPRGALRDRTAACAPAQHRGPPSPPPASRTAASGCACPPPFVGLPTALIGGPRPRGVGTPAHRAALSRRRERERGPQVSRTGSGRQGPPSARRGAGEGRGSACPDGSRITRRRLFPRRGDPRRGGGGPAGRGA